MSAIFADAVERIVARSALHVGYVAAPVVAAAELSRNLLLMRRILDELGHPQHALQIAHVAGSKGKATTCAHLVNIVTAHGLHSGLFTSPHINSWCERIAVDGTAISEADFAALATQVLHSIERVERREPELGPANAFQVILAMALEHFRNAQCPFAAIEVGLGGRFDPTNVLDPVVSVVTHLELEHAEILGPAIENIAWNKAGIFKPGVPAVALKSENSSADVLRSVARESGTPLKLEGDAWQWRETPGGAVVEVDGATIDRLSPTMPGAHQHQLAALAAVASQQLYGGTLPPSVDAIRKGIAATRLPGHFEMAEVAGRRFVLDVAHTPDSVSALLNGLFRAEISRFRVIAGFLDDKNIGDMLALLVKHASEVLVVPVRSPRSANEHQLRTISQGLDDRISVYSQSDWVLLPADSQQADSEWTIVTGSTALVAEVRERLGLANRS